MWQLALPLVLIEVGETVVFAVSTAFLGRLGTTELAAIGLADVLWDAWLIPVIALVGALQIVIARRIGQQRRADALDTFRRSLVLLAVVAGVRGGSCSRWSGGRSPSVCSVPGTWRGRCVTSCGSPRPVSRARGHPRLRGLVRGVRENRPLIGATVVLAVTNVGLDWLLVLGNLGAPALGIRGAALGMIGAEVAMLAYLVAHAGRSVGLPSSWRGLLPDPPLVGRLSRIGVPVGLQLLVEGLRIVLLFVILEQMGEGAVGASTIVYAVFLILLVPLVGFAEAVTAAVSLAVGRDRAVEIGRLLRQALAGAYLMTLPLALIGLVVPELLVSLFAPASAFSGGAAVLVRLVALAMAVVVPTELWFAAVAGTGDTDAAFLIEAVLTAVLLATAGATGLLLDLGVLAVWAGLPLAWAVGLVLCVLWLRRGHWRRRTV